MKKKKNKKIKTSTKCVVSAVIAVVGYMFTNAFLLAKCSLQLSDAITYGWFGFWSIEVWVLAGITKTKVKNHYYDNIGINVSEDYDETEINE